MVTLAALLLRHRRGRPVRSAPSLAFAVVGFLLALPAFVRMTSFVTTAQTSLTGVQELGNLGDPLEFVQVFGIWPSPDFRVGLSSDRAFAYVLLGTAGFAAALGVIAAVRRRAWTVLLFAGLSGLAFRGRRRPGVTVGVREDAHAPVAGVRPAGPATVAGWWDGRRRPEAVVLALALIVGVGWTTRRRTTASTRLPTTACRSSRTSATATPAAAARRTSSRRSTRKHFLRRTDPTGIVEALRPPEPVAAEGADVRFGFSSEPDDWRPDPMAVRCACSSSARVRRSAGRRAAGDGTSTAGTTTPGCSSATLRAAGAGRWARGWTPPAAFRAGRRASCATSRGGRRRAGVGPAPPGHRGQAHAGGGTGGWTVDPGDDETWRPEGQGRVERTVRTAGGRFSVWLEASVGRAASVYVDDRRVGVLTNHLNPRLCATAIGAVELAPGRHAVRLDLAGGSPDPRNGGSNRLIGPVFLAPFDDPGALPVRTVAADDWRSLCGERADWVEAVA